MNSIVDERVVSFINSFKKDDSTICQEIEKEARESYVPIIRKEMAEFLKTILAIKNPLNILEIGTAVGYSAILMSENISPKARITTIENYDVRIPIARNNFVRAGKEDVIKLIEGDAEICFTGKSDGKVINITVPLCITGNGGKFTVPKETSKIQWKISYSDNVKMMIAR